MDKTSHSRVIIAGGGLTGISAAMHLRQPYLLLERDGSLGGLARTRQREDFFFDETGHWLHLRDPYIKDLVDGVMGDGLVQVERRARIYSHQTLTPYPFQANLHGLPPQVVYQCLMGLIRARMEQGQAPPHNFEQYILYHFGEGIAQHFMIPYNTKLWGVHPREVTSAWCSRFVPIPDLEQVVAGSVGAGPAVMGYNTRFLYPRHGGIESLSRALAHRLDPKSTRLNAEVESVDPRGRTVSVGGEQIPYKALISSMPLRSLVQRIQDPPTEVVDAAGRLRATPVRYLNVASRTLPTLDYHWVYLPEERLPFYRVGVFSNAVASMAPPGCSNLYVELAHRKGAKDQQQEISEAVQGLVEIGALRSTGDVVFAELREIPCAYVIFDEHYQRSLDCIIPYLEGCRIYSRGRYGSWIYNAMEDSLLAGKETAEMIDAEMDGEDEDVTN